MESWLEKQPREVSLTIATRAALRVLPIMQEALRGYKDNYIILPVLRALAFTWTAAEYPARTNRYDAPPVGDLSAFGAATGAANAATAAFAVIRGTGNSFGAVFKFAEDACYAYHGVDVILEDAAGDAYGAVCTDATRVEEVASASIVAGSPLWPQNQPERLLALWQEMKARPPRRRTRLAGMDHLVRRPPRRPRQG